MIPGKSEHPKVSVIVVNWNGRHLLEECLSSLFSQDFRDHEVILVDNGSTDGSAEFVRRAFPRAVLVELPQNLGFAGGTNAGIARSTGEYIALLNNDTRADEEWLGRLIVAAEKEPRAGMWASKILTYDRPDVIDNTGLLLYGDGLARGRGRLEPDRGQYDGIRDALFPSGCAGLYRRTMLDEIGLLDEDFFAYADDVDLGLRGRLAGWGCSLVPEAKVYHRYSSSSSSYSRTKAFLVERNRIWVLFKYYPWELIFLSLYHTLRRLLYQLYGALSGKGASGRFAAESGIAGGVIVMLRAWAAALAGLPRVLRQRKALAGLRRMTRKEIYSLFREFGLPVAEVSLKD